MKNNFTNQHLNKVLKYQYKGGCMGNWVSYTKLISQRESLGSTVEKKKKTAQQQIREIKTRQNKSM